ncbi:hypothetical protein [Clostridium sp.]|uniref:hypothetical protein n=1 Tax=Clostridium sp. TaxID=1506 RepID=UPI00321768A3
MNNSNYTSPSNELSNSKQYTVVIGEGKKKMYITNKFSGEDKRKEAADFILGNKKYY